MTKKLYNIVNNVAGWVVFAIALVTYWVTLEDTASYWDCGEFIIQADKLEVGHPPGNPIFMLTARFFANFASDAGSVSVMVNAMSGLLSALTILLLFWTITHLSRRLLVHDDSADSISLAKAIVIFGAGVVGALAYTWSDTFWFSAVEGEVYAFSSFCTALVFWLILKWESVADNPSSDRYLILIAYVIGVSIAVHLLNLLCIPAIVLVFAYRKWKDVNLVKSLIALGVSFVIIALVLFGLVPGFIKMAQRFELLFVNGFHLNFNSGAIAYAVIAAISFIWCIFEIRRQKSALLIKLSFLIAVTISGMLFMGKGWWFGWILTALLAGFLFSKLGNRLSLRVLNVIMWSIAVIFVGYSSYALILIRASAATPMNQNAPDNVFDLASYLNREQYGETPLIYGETLYSGQQKKLVQTHVDTVSQYEDGSPVLLTTPEYTSIVEPGAPIYAKGVKGAEPTSEYGFLDKGEQEKNARLEKRGGDYYVKRDYTPEVKMNPELNMFFPRIYSRAHREYYPNWVTLDTVPSNIKELTAIDESGNKVPEIDLYGEPFINPATGYVTYPVKMGYRPTFAQNLAYFFNYQLIHMYMRYFMWNFSGRQNDVLNQQGELDAGNWITGISFLDNARLGDQSLLPDELGKNNPGHNVYYMLPLILGLLGLIWQAFAGKRGIEQFWVVFFLFFMTGIAIVLYLNQPPMQPRERDYAYAGSFYAFAIWIGLGVAGLWSLIRSFSKTDKELWPSIVAVVVGLIVPVQMVAQNWDDHDRSRRTAARDFAINYLESLEPNAIVFCNGDNDTFPLWYAQEVEGVRPDVKIINLSYLASDWYANQMRTNTYSAPPVDFTATPEDYAYGKLDVVLTGSEKAPVDLMTALKYIYSGKGRDNAYGYPMLPSAVVSVPVDKEAVIKRGLVAAKDSADIVDEIVIDLSAQPSVRKKGYVSLSELLMLDIIATNAAKGWPRPIYWCMTVGEEYHLGLTSYLRGVGMTHQLTPTYQEGMPARNDRALNVVTKYKWGGADNPDTPYFDETARRMLISTRTTMLDVASELNYEGDKLASEGDTIAAEVKYRKAVEVCDLMLAKLKESTWPMSLANTLTVAEIYGQVGTKLKDKKVIDKALAVLEKGLERNAKYVRYNMDITMRFGQVPMTLESRMMPYQYYRFIQLWNNYGGDKKKLDAIVAKTGMKESELKHYYETAYGGGAQSAAGAEDVTEEQLVAELADAARTVLELEKLSPEEYAARPDDDRLIDSIYGQAYDQYSGMVGEEKLKANPDISKVDMQRSRRISGEYNTAHPQH
ncbi:MAG: DUF2723 domain-containing protein [Muribaculaceae bacterium]|nr:DUF2723 domain-containing protein [Muribaculaceae bacterium]